MNPQLIFIIWVIGFVVGFSFAYFLVFPIYYADKRLTELFKDKTTFK